MNLIFYLILALGFLVSTKNHMNGLKNTTLLYVVIYIAIQFTSLYYNLSKEKSMWVYVFFLSAYA